MPPAIVAPKVLNIHSLEGDPQVSDMVAVVSGNLLEGAGRGNERNVDG